MRMRTWRALREITVAGKARQVRKVIHNDPGTTLHEKLNSTHSRKKSRNRPLPPAVLTSTALIFFEKPGMSSYQTALQSENLITRADEENVEGAVHVARSDRQLVEQVISGDEFAFEQIFDRHKRMVAVVAGRYFRRPEQIEEIIQISFAKAFVELARFRGAHDLSLASWLARITVNACLDNLRSQKRKPENLCCELTDGETTALTELAVDGGAQSAEQEMLDRDLAEKLLAHVGEEDRALLEMLYVEEMSVAEIAGLTGWSQSKVKIKAWRARNTLRRTLRKFL